MSAPQRPILGPSGFWAFARPHLDDSDRWRCRCPVCAADAPLDVADADAVPTPYGFAGACDGGHSVDSMAEMLGRITGLPIVELIAPLRPGPEVVAGVEQLLLRHPPFRRAYLGVDRFRSNDTRRRSLALRLQEAGADVGLVAVADALLDGQMAMERVS